MSETTQTEPLAGGGMAVDVDALYTAAEAARYLRCEHRKKSVYDIPARELPRTRVGPRRGRVLFAGRDLIAYAERGRSAA